MVKLGLSPLQTEHLLPRVICVRCYCVRESACASSIAGIDSEGAAKHVCPGGTLHDAHSLAHALLQRLPIAEAAKASAHRAVLGTAVDTALLPPALSFSGLGRGATPLNIRQAATVEAIPAHFACFF